MSQNPKNIAEYRGGGIYKPTLQAEILQNPEELKYINQYYRHKYYKFLKIRGSLLTKNPQRRPTEFTSNGSVALESTKNIWGQMRLKTQKGED